MSLPEAFWNANEHGVKGGIDGAFMSTTMDKEVALQYAASGGRGIVFEIQQGMIDRGADISWLSQYPHEQEILFGPLVKSTCLPASLPPSLPPSLKYVSSPHSYRPGSRCGRRAWRARCSSSVSA